MGLAAADLPNAASFRVMERLGMTSAREGRPRNNPLKFYSISPRDFRCRRRRFGLVALECQQAR